jgi:hypothetical protein
MHARACLAVAAPQMYCFFTNVVVVEYGVQANRLRLLPSDHESLQQAVLPSAAKKPTPNTVMCMEYCDGALQLMHRYLLRARHLHAAQEALLRGATAPRQAPSMRSHLPLAL